MKRGIRKVPRYLGLVLKHACKNEALYKGELEHHCDPDAASREILIPLPKELKQCLRAWARNSSLSMGEQAVFLLKRHLDLQIDPNDLVG